MNKHTIFILIAIGFISSCQPSEKTIQTAIAQTQVALPMPTFMPSHTPLPTVTPIPLNTPRTTPVFTSSPSPSPVSLNKLIDIDPRMLLLQYTDLPNEGNYYLPGEDWTSPQRNSEIISAWTVKKGEDYLAETGRIDGWWVGYKRGKVGVLLPEEVYDSVVIYSKVEGARITVLKHGDKYITEDNYTEITAPQIGDTNRAFQRLDTNSNGETRVSIAVIFSYQNIYHGILIWGWEKEVALGFAIDVATGLVNTLKQLPLSETVTFRP